MQIQTRSMYDYNHSQMMMSSSASTPPTLGYIQHQISKLDTLAGIAIKYGVQVADIKKMNGLVTDSQMFALKSIGIPLNGKHPPPITTGYDNTHHSPADDNATSLRRKPSEQKLSPVMNCLRSHYGTKPTMKKSASEIFSMAEYEKRASKCSENGSFYNKSPMSPQQHSHHKKSHSLENETLDDIMEVVKARRSGSDRRSDTLIRRSYKSEANLQHIPELLLKQNSNNSNGGFSFSPRSAKGLAQRQKSGSRIALTAYSNQVV